MEFLAEKKAIPIITDLLTIFTVGYFALTSFQPCSARSLLVNDVLWQNAYCLLCHGLQSSINLGCDSGIGLENLVRIYEPLNMPRDFLGLVSVI